MLDPGRLDFAHLVALQLDQADVAIRTLGQPAKCRTARWSVKTPAPGLDRTDAVGLDMAYRGSDPPGTVSSNPSSSSGESVSHTDQAAAGLEPRLSRGSAPLSWRQRRAGHQSLATKPKSLALPHSARFCYPGVTNPFPIARTAGAGACCRAACYRPDQKSSTE